MPICAWTWQAIIVMPDCSLPGHPEVFVIGDAAFPRRVEVRDFTAALADLGELAVFVALGLTILM